MRTNAALQFFVEGVPQPQGSKTVYRGRAVDANAVRLKPWRKQVTEVAFGVMDTDEPFHGPLEVTLQFQFPRPKSIKDGVRWKVARPDIDKLARAVLDGLTDAKVWDDDSQVCRLVVTKWFTRAPGVFVFVDPLVE